MICSRPILPYQMRSLLSSLACLILVVAGQVESSTALAQDLQPLGIRNENPLLRIFNIPAQANSIILLPGRTSFDAGINASNYFTARGVESEEVRLDGETQRVTLTVARGFRHGLEAGIEASWISRNGGIMDGIIDDWHQAFDLPRLGRDRVDRGQVDIRYTQGEVDRIRIDESGSGPGDLLLFAGKQLVNKTDGGDSGLGVSLRGQLSVPTGDADQLRGSGGVNVATWVQATRRFKDRWSIYGNAGLSWLGQGDVLPELQRRWMIFGGAGLGWQATRGLSLKIQVDSQSSAYQDTALEQLGSHAAQLSFGGTYNFSEKFMLDIGVTENIIRTEVSPDLTFAMTGRSRF